MCYGEWLKEGSCSLSLRGCMEHSTLISSGDYIMTDNLSLADNQLQEPVHEQIQEEEQERLYKEHQTYLDSFPTDTLFYDHIVEKDGTEVS
jgi:hypothetical protein